MIDLLDVDAFLRLRVTPRPRQTSGMLDKLKDAGMIRRGRLGSWDMARDLRAFSDFERKSLRIIHYNGNDRTEAKPEQPWTQGNAAGFANILKFHEGVPPALEVIGAIRTEDRGYPSDAIKEPLADTLI